MIYIRTTCPFCGKNNFVKVKTKDYQVYEEGSSIRAAFPYLSEVDYELISNGICSDCWKTKVYIPEKEYRNNGFRDDCNVIFQ